MQEAVPVGKGSMIAVLGSKIDDLSDLIKEVKIKGCVKLQMIMQKAKQL